MILAQSYYRSFWITVLDFSPAASTVCAMLVMGFGGNPEATRLNFPLTGATL